jgi:antirestriction protein ArdC
MIANKKKEDLQTKRHLDRHYQDMIDRIISQIKAGTAPWQKSWKPDQEVLPRSLATGRKRPPQNKKSDGD